MSYDRFGGDPRIILDGSGADLDWRGGQPTMDQGLENQAIISLFTEPGWSGNAYLPRRRQVGSAFMAATRRPITMSALNDIRNAAELAVKSDSDYFPDAEASVTNPTTDRLAVALVLGPGATLTMDNKGLLWRAQSDNPANGRIAR